MFSRSLSPPLILPQVLKRVFIWETINVRAVCRGEQSREIPEVSREFHYSLEISTTSITVRWFPIDLQVEIDRTRTRYLFRVMGIELKQLHCLLHQHLLSNYLRGDGTSLYFNP